MNSRVLGFALAGLVIGVLIAEYKPDLVGDVWGGLKAAFSGPFSEYRNRLALRYGLSAAAAGAVIGFVIDNLNSKK